MSTRAVAHGILSGELPYDVQVAAPGVPLKWLRAVEMPVIAQIVESEPTGKYDLPPVDSSDEAHTPRRSDEEPIPLPVPVGEGTTPVDALPPTRPAFTGQSPPTTRPYKRLDETVRSAEMGGNAAHPPDRKGGQS